MKKMNKKSGFTLVEIMIVVAIIGLLAAIGIPSFSKARAGSRKNTCINNLRQIDSATQQWAMENNGTDASTPTTAQLGVYIKGDWAAIECPEGGTAYAAPANVGTLPVCPNVGTFAEHTL